MLAKIENYNGHIKSYKRYSSISTIAASLNAATEIDIQDELGEIENEEFKYEVYLTVKGLNNYKYRMFFVRYGSISYPVTIVLNSDIAYECFRKNKTNYLINNEKDLKEMLDTIINSQYIIKVVQSLIYEGLRREQNQNIDEKK